jgi:molybdopterin converting factor small subunit
MPIVYIPSLLRDLTNGQETVTVSGETVHGVIAALERLYPGIQARLCEGDALRPGLALVVDTEISRKGLRHALTAASEVHFLPQVGGG